MGSESSRPQPPRPRDVQGAQSQQSPLDLIEGVAFAEGDANVAAVDAIAPGPHRASPFGMAVDLGKILLALAIALAGIVISVLTEGKADKPLPGWVIPAVFAGIVLLVALMAAWVVVSWRVRTWELADDALVLRSGLLVRKQRRIPYQRVHSVDLSSSVVQRVLGLTTLKVDTGAGGTDVGNGIEHIARAEAEVLKRTLFARRVLVTRREAEQDGSVLETARPQDEAAFASDPAGDIDYEMTLPNRLHLIASFTDFNIGAVFAAVAVAVAAVVQFAGQFLGNYIYDLIAQAVVDTIGDMAEQVSAITVSSLLPLAVGGAVVFVVVTLLVTEVVSAAVAFIRWGGFVLRRRAGRIEVSCGLLTRSTRVVELARVQELCIDQSPLRRATGYVQIAVRTVVTKNGNNSDANKERVVVHPCIRREEARAFVAQVLPEFADTLSVPVADLGLRRLPAAALRRTLVHGAGWTLLVAALAALAIWQLGRAQVLYPHSAVLLTAATAMVWVASVAGCAAMFLVRVLAWRIRRIGTVGSTLATVDGGIARRVSFTVRPKIQSLTRQVTIFQKRSGVASIAVRTACTYAVSDARMRDVDASQAADLMEWVRPHYNNDRQANEALAAAGIA